MIDWINLGGNAFWVIGLVVGLSTLSYASWKTSITEETFRAIFQSKVFKTYIFLSEFLFSIGLAITSEGIIERSIWYLLSLAAVAQLLFLFVKERTSEKEK